MTIQRSPLAAFSGWLGAACLSVAAHAGILAWLPHAEPVGPAPSSQAPGTMHVRLLAPEPEPESSTPREASIVATNMASPPQSKPAALDQASTKKRAPSARSESAKSEPAPVDPWSSYLPSGTLDLPPLPRSSPDLTVLTGTSSSGLPLRLRLFVDEHGHVVEVLATQVSPGDEEVVARLRLMFLETLFLPGKLNGADVASYMDLELAITEVK